VSFRVRGKKGESREPRTWAHEVAELAPASDGVVPKLGVIVIDAKARSG